MPAPSYVQSAGSPAGSGNAAFTLVSSPTAGNVLLAFVGYNSSFSVSPPSGWTQVFNINNGSGVGLACWWHAVQSGDGTTYTFTVTGDYTSGELYEISGASASSPVNGYLTGNGTTSPTSLPSPAVTPSVLDCLPFAAVTNNNGDNIVSVTSGWTLLKETGNFHGGGAAYGPGTTDTVTAISCTFSYSGGSSPWCDATVLIQPGGAPPSPPPRHPLIVTRPAVSRAANW